MMIFELIKNQLEDRVKTTEGVKKVDWYNQQYQFTEKESGTRYPVVYIEFLDPVEWEETGREFQHGDVIIRLHVVVYDVTDSPSRTIAFAQNVFKNVNGKSLYMPVVGDNDFQLTTELTRVRTTMPKRYNQLKVVMMDFKCQAFDTSVMPEYTETPTAPTFTIT